MGLLLFGSTPNEEREERRQEEVLQKGRKEEVMRSPSQKTRMPGGKTNKFKGDIHNSGGKGAVGKPGGPGGIGGKRMAAKGGRK